MKLNILTYNIHKGFDWRNKNYFLKEIKDLIKSSKANLVLLQEVVGLNSQYTKKGLIDSQLEFLADEIWPHYSYAKNAVYKHGHHGNMILSQLPIQTWVNINLSTNPFEKRGLLFCKIGLDSKNYFYAGCTHLNLLPQGRSLQFNLIKKYIQTLNLSENRPLVLAGDFNDWNKHASQILKKDLLLTENFHSEHKAYAKTYPAIYPVLSLDRIYTKNLKIIKSYVFPKHGTHFSDHLPLYSEVLFSEN